MADAISHFASEQPARQPRGSYAKLICLNCRARKIKCNLPTDVQIEPSQHAQPHELACTRCRQQGLECIVDKTVLGRPAQKRQRPEQLTAEKDRLTIEDAGDGEQLDPNVQDFVLSDLRDEVHDIDVQVTANARTKPSKREVFESLTDSAHLFSAMMARDENFASLVFQPTGDGAVDVTRLVDNDLMVLLDEHLIWVRLHSPYLPTLVELHQKLSIDHEGQNGSSTRALFLLLCMIALEVPSKRLRASTALHQQLQSLSNSDCQRLLFNTPIHKHALFALELIDSYKPFALAGSQSVAALSLKGSLSRTLAKRTAQKLGFDTSVNRLKSFLQQSTVTDVEKVQDLVLETLIWCKWLMLDSIVDGYVMKSTTEQSGPLPEVKKILAVVKMAVERFSLRPAVLFMYHHLSSANAEMHAAVSAKRHWLDLAALSNLIDAHDRRCEAYKDYIDQLLVSCDRSSNPRAEEEIRAIKQIRKIDLNASHVRISGLSMFYGLMSGLRPPGINTREITPDEAVQVSSEIISNLTTKHDTLSDPTSIASFISKYGDPRFAREEQLLRDFISTADSLSLNGVPYTPPSVPTVSFLLQTCREIVENNSTRLKGWGGMHPNIDVHLILLQDVAKRLDNMDSMGGGSDAIARGSIYASGAKLIRSLCGIIAAWRKTMIEQEVKDVAEQGLEAWMPDEFEGFDAFLSDDLLDDWNEWPQAEDLDFTELLADGLEWVDWAQLTSPLDGANLGF